MSKVQSVGQLVDTGVQRMSGTEKPTTTPEQGLSAKQRLKILDVWEILFSRRLVHEPAGSHGHKVFERDVADLSARELETGIERSKDFIGFFTTAEFRRLCKPKPSDFGLPDAATAMREACSAPFPKDRHAWSHPAVYLAACAVGWYDMQNRTERELLPIFEAAYEVLVRRVVSGEQLDVPVPKAIPAEIPQYLSKNENLARCAALKELLA
jgi:hypothetical protein